LKCRWFAANDLSVVSPFGEVTNFNVLPNTRLHERGVLIEVNQLRFVYSLNQKNRSIRFAQ